MAASGLQYRPPGVVLVPPLPAFPQPVGTPGYACSALSFLLKSHNPSGPSSDLLDFTTCPYGVTVFLGGRV